MDYSNDNETNSRKTQIDELSLSSTRETITGDKSNSRFCERREMQGLFLKPVLKQLGNRVSQKFLTNLLCFSPPRNLFASDALANELSVWGKETAKEKIEKEKNEGMKESL